MDALPGAVVVERTKVVVDARPQPEVAGQHPPSVAGAVDVKDGVNDPTHVGAAGPAAGQRLRDQRLYERPLLIGQV